MQYLETNTRVKILHEQILDTLAAVDTPENYCANGIVPLVLRGLEVEGLGSVALPLTANTAQDLIAHCHQAPFMQTANTK